MIIRSLSLVMIRSQLLGIKHPPTLDHPPDALGVLDVLQRIGIEQHDVGELAWFQRAQIVLRIDGRCSLLGGDSEYLERRYARLGKQFQLPVKRRVPPVYSSVLILLPSLREVG